MKSPVIVNANREDEPVVRNLIVGNSIVKKKHWPLNFTVGLPGDPEKELKIEANSSLKLKQLKLLVKERGKIDVGEDRIQLRIEGGDILKKQTLDLEQLGLKDNQHIVVEILDKVDTAANGGSTKKVTEPKQKVFYRERIEEEEVKEGEN